MADDVLIPVTGAMVKRTLLAANLQTFMYMVDVKKKGSDNDISSEPEVMRDIQMQMMLCRSSRRCGDLMTYATKQELQIHEWSKQSRNSRINKRTKQKSIIKKTYMKGEHKYEGERKKKTRWMKIITSSTTTTCIQPLKFHNQKKGKKKCRNRYISLVLHAGGSVLLYADRSHPFAFFFFLKKKMKENGVLT
jgi:hypothetical protein